MISFDDAIHKIETIATPLSPKKIPFADCARLTLAEDLNARSNAPAHNVSAMDGYGVRDKDLSGLNTSPNTPIRLPIHSESFAGSEPQKSPPEGSCVRIFTGAPVPEGIDRVIIQENVERDGDFAVFKTPPSQNDHIRKTGSDFQAGQTLLTRGTQLNWKSMTTAAAADQGTLLVYPRPRLIVLATGDELMPPGQAHTKLGSIPESVSYGINTLIVENGAQVVRSERLNDDPRRLEKAAKLALREADIIVVTGGASVGERDYAKSMFEKFGMEMIFSKVAMKPGKPVWCARVGHTIILGLPGNPSSALVTARLFLKPLLLGLSGRAIKDCTKAKMIESCADIPANGDRENFMRGYLEDGKINLFSFQDSSSQLTLAKADILIRRPPNAPAAKAGDKLPVYDF
ncbi:gephyrin-like molybdotransferase Glp [Hirschia litorea]|uniref:Molybdopterin molybdenumtransferase n=1 Tax=Hirschia litorea TaxID=1199156 RepID=A0ABW2IIK2_9PROT